MKRIISIIISALLLAGVQLNAQIDRTKAPEPGPAPKVEFGSFEKFTLKNGLRVILVEDHERPSVSMTVNFLVDPSVEGDKAGVSSVFGDLWEEGTKTRTAEQLKEEVDFLGARLNTGATQIGFSSLKKYVDRMMELMADVLYNPTFPQEELDKLKEQYLGGLKMSKTSPSAIIENIGTATVFPKDHAYGDIVTEATVAAINVEDCRDYYIRNIMPNNAIMVIVGDMTLEEAQKLCKQYFGSWKKGKIQSRTWPLGKMPEGIEVVFSPKDGAVQSSIKMMTPLDIKPHADDLLALSVANGIYGGGDFSAKLMKNLRETKGYTYGAYSSVNADRFSGSFVASAEVNADATDSSFIEMRKELENMKAGDYTDEDVEKFKVLFAGSFSRSLEDPDNIASYAYQIERYGLPENYYADYLRRLEAVTREDVQNVIDKYFDPQNMYYFAVGDPSVLPGLTALDSDGKVAELDYEGKPIEKKAVAADVTAGSIIEKYLEYIGGRQLVEAVVDATSVSEMQMMGMTATSTTKVLPAEKCFSMVQAMGGNPVMTMKLADGKLSVGGVGGSQEITDAAQIEEMVGDQLEIFPELTAEYELVGMESVDGKDAYKLKYGKGEAAAYVFFDVASGAKVKTVATTQGQTLENVYVGYALSDYGIKYPSVVKMDLPQVGEVEMKIEMKFNTGLSRADF